MIVSLDEVKTVLGIDLADTTQDVYLTRLIKAKTDIVEGITKRRFDTPIQHTQIEEGSGEFALFLDWHVDDGSLYTPALDPDPAASIQVFRRPVLERYRAWEELIEGEDWERDGQTILFLRAWQVWPVTDEFKLTYLGGYGAAPEDIKEVVIDLVRNQYLVDTTTSSGTAGVTSETIGDYSYDNRTSGTSVATGTLTLSDLARQTLGRYTRRFI